MGLDISEQFETTRAYSGQKEPWTEKVVENNPR